MKPLPADWIKDAEAALPDMVELRRAIHAEPEIGLDNRLTKAKVCAALKGLPLTFRDGGSTSGLVATLTGAAPGPTVLLRGDTDALPLQEDTGLPFASRFDGVMHACGHDAHTAMLAGAAKILCARRDALAGQVQFMFQPGEEGWHGAKLMLDEGLIDPLPDAAFALHVMPNGRHGLFMGKPGPLLASADEIYVRVVGAGGHASMPHQAMDPVPVACEIVLAIQTFMTRRIAPMESAVVTVGQITAGTTDNIIPETAHLAGTIRTLSADTRALIHSGLKKLAMGIAMAHGLAAEVEIVPGFPVTVCDGRAVALGRAAARDLFGPDGWEDLDQAIMGAEDFSYLLEKVPGAMFFMGAAQAETDWAGACPCHSNRMILDETTLAKGAAMHAELATRFLAQGFPTA